MLGILWPRYVESDKGAVEFVDSDRVQPSVRASDSDEISKNLVTH